MRNADLHKEMLLRVAVGLGAELLPHFVFVGGFNWVIVKQSAKPEYMEALESASVAKDIKPFFGFILDMMVANRGKESI